MDDLIESLEAVVADCEWAMACDWSPGKVREMIAGIVSQVRHAIDQAKDEAFLRA